MHGTITYSPKRNKQASMNALFNDVQFFGMDVVRNTSQWDALTCDEQMRLEDLINTL